MVNTVVYPKYSIQSIIIVNYVNFYNFNRQIVAYFKQIVYILVVKKSRH